MNEDIFITSIHVKKVRNIEDFTIPLSETERKHLIITGKNGSGKTSLLQEMDRFFRDLLYGNGNVQKDRIEVLLKNTQYLTEKCLVSFFESRRFNKSDIPNGINKIDLRKKYHPTERISNIFIQYIVNLKAERSFARDDGDNKSVKRIDIWFENFENHLKELFDASNLKLVFDRQNYNFYIQIGNNESFNLNELSDGYSSIVSIITELILRMEATGNKAYDMQGVVLIDEIETHLHVALQKKIMPFLCAFFPNIQFIVTTHSPFVISSISNAVVCDLETREVFSDLSGYSYEALVESYFDTDKYSEKLKEKLSKFETLAEKSILTEQEQDEYDTLERYFKELPKFYADELTVKLQQIKLNRMARP